MGNDFNTVNNNMGDDKNKMSEKNIETYGGCKQFVYCNECMLYPMGLDCPKIEKKKSNKLKD